MFVQIHSNALVADGRLVPPQPFNVGDFNDELLTNFKKHLQDHIVGFHTICPLIIDSHGGSVSTLHAILDIIDSLSGISFPRIVNGKAMSCGALLASLGNKGTRYISPSSKILIHQAQGLGYGSSDDVENLSKELKRVNDDLFKRLDAAAGKKSGYFAKKIKQNKGLDWYITPKQALKLKLVDYIGIPQIIYQVHAETKIINPEQI